LLAADCLADNCEYFDDGMNNFNSLIHLNSGIIGSRLQPKAKLEERGWPRHEELLQNAKNIRYHRLSNLFLFWSP
jgi:hypothetical protein